MRPGVWVLQRAGEGEDLAPGWGEPGKGGGALEEVGSPERGQLGEESWAPDGLKPRGGSPYTPTSPGDTSAPPRRH